MNKKLEVVESDLENVLLGDTIKHGTVQVALTMGTVYSVAMGNMDDVAMETIESVAMETIKIVQPLELQIVTHRERNRG